QAAIGVGHRRVAAGLGIDAVGETVGLADGNAGVDHCGAAGAANGVDAEAVVAAASVGIAAVAYVDRVPALDLDAGAPVAAFADRRALVVHADVDPGGEDAVADAVASVGTADRRAGVGDGDVAVDRVAVQADAIAVGAVGLGDGRACIGDGDAAVDRAALDGDGVAAIIRIGAGVTVVLDDDVTVAEGPYAGRSVVGTGIDGAVVGHRHPKIPIGADADRIAVK